MHAPMTAFDETKIDAIFAELDQGHLPGAAVGIAIGGQPVYRKGFGLASMELPIVLSPTIRMRIGSTTKHFTCLAYMLLCEEGRAGIDDPVGKHLPELHPVTHQVTMRQLMGHVSGLRDAHAIGWLFSSMERPLPSAELLALYHCIDDVHAAPGTSWMYNNGGYLLLTSAIERIAGQSFEQFLRERIFVPVGMYETLVRRSDNDVVPNSAALHAMQAKTSAESCTDAARSSTGPFGKTHMGISSAGGGGIVSTVDDMLRWLAHMEAPVVGTAETWRTLQAPQRLANGTSTGYGLGLMTGRYRGLEMLFHSGGLADGGSSQMLKVPAAGLEVVVMVNRSDTSAALLAEKVLDVCLARLDPVREACRRPFAAATFHSPATGRVVQLLAKGGQQIAVIDGIEMTVEPDDEGTLWPAGTWKYANARQALTLAGDWERPDSIQLSDFGNVDDLLPILPTRDPGARVIAGRYRLKTIGVDAVITATDSGARLSARGGFGSSEFELACLGDGIWRCYSTAALPIGGMLVFDGDGAAFRFSSARVQSLPFRRCS